MRHCLLILPLALLALAGCARESTAPPISTAPVGDASQMPQPQNSLPLGSAVDAPLDPSAGNVGTTRVGPSRPVRPAPRRQ